LRCGGYSIRDICGYYLDVHPWNGDFGAPGVEKQLNSGSKKVDFLPNAVFLKETADFL